MRCDKMEGENGSFLSRKEFFAYEFGYMEGRCKDFIYGGIRLCHANGFDACIGSVCLWRTADRFDALIYSVCNSGNLDQKAKEISHRAVFAVFGGGDPVGHSAWHLALP